MVSGLVVQQNALKKLRAAKSLSQTVFISASFGYGKTTLIKNYLKNRNFIYLSCLEIPFDPENDPFKKVLKSSGTQVVVIDDLQALSSGELRADVVDLCNRDDIWLIILSRGAIPQWLISTYISAGFILIQEKDLAFTKSDVIELYLMFGIEFSEQDADLVLKFTGGNAFAVKHVATKILEGAPFGPNLQQELEESMCLYIENSIIDQWDADVAEFLMQMCMNDEFTLELAEMVSGNPYSAMLIQKALDTGNFLTYKDGVYTFSPLVRRALQNRTLKLWGSARMRELAYNAGLYYEMHGQIVQSLREYVKCERQDRVKFLLVRNARNNFGNGHYFELRNYYFELDDESIASNPVLIAAMCMLYSLVLQPKESERYYQQLIDFSKQSTGGLKREALGRLAYLDIALPHKSPDSILDVIKDTVETILNKGIEMPEISITGNMPSIMNGGKDLCHVVETFEHLTHDDEVCIRRVLGKFADGFFPCFQAEIYYQRSTPPERVLPLLTQSQLLTEGSGQLEIAFVSVRIQVCLNLQLGNMESAKMILSSFRERVVEGGSDQLLGNVDALQCRIALLEGDKAGVKNWLAGTSDENKEFNIMDRYKYVTKIRCYLSLYQNAEALHLIEKLKFYAERYYRHYLMIEVNLLSAIAKDRLHIDWHDDLIYALKHACDMGFVKVVADEGGAISPLLKQLDGAALDKADISKSWYMQVLKKADDMSLYFPAYLRRNVSDSLNFTKNALDVLRLQADGLSINKIAERLGLKPDTVKYHAKENYRKLGVSGKMDAVLMARSMGLL